MILAREGMVLSSKVFLGVIRFSFLSTLILIVPGTSKGQDNFRQEASQDAMSVGHSALLPESWARKAALVGTMPSYPKEAIRKGISGVVYVKFQTSPAGEVIRIKVKPGTDELLSKAVAEALKDWKFKPWPGVDGLPETVFSRLAFRFVSANADTRVELHDPDPHSRQPLCLECSSSNKEMNDWKDWKEVWSRTVEE